MVFTIIVCFLFLFLTLSVGNWLAALPGIFQSERAYTFQNLLCGFAFISCYLNTWSLFLPVNYSALFPVFIFSLFISKYSWATISKIRRLCTAIFSHRFAIIAVPIVAVIIAYALLPPQHGDSPGYHFLTIRWNEEYKVIPGLANLHGRLGFNSSFFVSSAAFAFSDVASQPLYVLNIVFVLSYFLWLLNKTWHYRTSLWSTVFVFVAVAMFRQLLDSISSPTPDVLATIIISYVFITTAESIFINDKPEQIGSVSILLLICFAFTVKLSTFPLCFIGLFLFLKNRMYRSWKTVLLIIGVSCVILIPWTVRNYILTGYLVFPVSATGFLHPGWKVPGDVLHFEKLLINNGPKLISQNWEGVDALSFTQWFPLWIKAHFTEGLTFSLVILVTAIVTGVTSIVVAIRKQRRSLFWLAFINIISIAFWIYNSPDYRFGYPYLVNAILLLGLYVTRNKSLTPPAKSLVAALVIFICAYYLKHAVTILSPYAASSYICRPLQAPQYDPQKELSNFPFIMLNGNVKLYVEDKEHWCNMAALPCIIPYNDKPIPQIQLRGSDVEDGFRVIGK